MTYTLKNGHLRFNDGVKSIEDYFRCDEAITVDLNEVVTVGNNFLYSNKVLTSFSAPNLTTVGNCFLFCNEVLTSLTAPNLTTVGNNFLLYNEVLTSLTAPNLTTVGNNFLYCNKVLTSFSAPNLTTVGNCFLHWNKVLTSFTSPNLETVGNGFLYSNKVLTSFTAPNITTVGYNFLIYNEVLTSFKTKSYSFNVIKRDELTFVIQSTKTKGELTIYKGFILNSIQNDILNKRDGYLVVNGEHSAHGDTLKGALSDLETKINADKLSKEPINADTIITIDRYHYATGSCKSGIQNWMEQTRTKEGLTAAELLPILEMHNAYGIERFKQLITFKP